MGCDVVDRTRPNGGFLSVDIEPYKSYHKPSEFRVTLKYYQDKVVRCSLLPEPFHTTRSIRPGQWTKKKCLKWLMEHPIHSEDEKKWILQKEQQF